MRKLFFDMFNGLYISAKREKIISNKIAPYCFGKKDQYDIFHIWLLSHTLQKVLNFSQNVIHARKGILVNTVKKNYRPFVLYKTNKKKIRKKIRKKIAFLFSIKQWIGGTLTNFRKTYQRFLYYKKIIPELQTRRVTQYKLLYRQLIYRKKPRLPHFLFSLRENHWAVNEAKLLAIKVAQCSENNFRTDLVDFNFFFRQNKTALNFIFSLINNCVSQSNLAERIYFRNKFIKFIKKKSIRRRRITRIVHAIYNAIAYYTKTDKKINKLNMPIPKLTLFHV